MLKTNLFARNNIVNIIITLTAVLICVVLIIGPFQRGLFFDREFLPVQVFLLFLFVLWCGTRLLGRKNDTFMQTPLHWCFFVLVIFYALSISGAVHIRAAVGESLRVAVYFAVFLMVFDIVRLKKEYIHLFLYALLFSAVVTALGGLGAAAGSWEIHGAYVDGRLESSLQYANTAAAYFMAGFFLALGLSTTLVKWYLRPLLLVPCAVLIVAIFFTYSRGVWLLLPFLALLMLALTGAGERVRLLFYMLITLGCSFPFLLGMAKALEGGQSGAVWLYLFAAVLSSTAGGYGVEFIDRFNGSLKLLLYGCLVLVLLLTGTFTVIQELRAPESGAYLRGEVNGPLQPEQQLESVAPHRVALSKVLPESVYYGIYSREESVGLRFAHYRDALQIIRDYPLLGAGGGGWVALYTGYQDQFYIAQEVHNHFLQVWVEAGVFAFMAFCGIWLLSAFYFIRSFCFPDVPAAGKRLQVAVVVSIAALVGHSVLDFNLSYGVVNIFLYTLLGVGSAIIYGEMKASQHYSRNHARTRGQNRPIALIVALAAGVVLFVFTLNLWSGNRAAQRAASHADRQEYFEAAAYFGRAIKEDPLQAINYHNLAQLYEFFATLEEDAVEAKVLKDDALTLAAGAYELEPFNPVYNLDYGAMLFRRGFGEEGLYFVERLPEINPYNGEHFLYVAITRLMLAEQFLGIDETGRQRAADLLHSIAELEREMGIYHGETGVLNFYLGKAAYLSGDFEQALAYLMEVDESDVNYGESRFYLQRSFEATLETVQRGGS